MKEDERGDREDEGSLYNHCSAGATRLGPAMSSLSSAFGRGNVRVLVPSLSRACPPRSHLPWAMGVQV